MHSNDSNTIPPNWEDLVINHRFRNDIDDGDVEDTWEQPTNLSPEPTTAPPMTDHHRNTPTADSHDIDPGLLPLPTPQQKENVTDAPPAQKYREKEHH